MFLREGRRRARPPRPIPERKTMRRLLPRTATFAVLLALGAAAQAADLLSVYRAAKQYDATFAAARYGYDAGRENAEQGTALLLPKVNLDANYMQQRQESSPSVSRATGAVSNASNTVSGYSRGWSLSLAQPLYNAQALVGNTQLQEQARLAEVQFRAAEQDLIVRVAQAYFDVLYAQDNIEFVKAQKEAVAQQLAQAKKAFEVGTATITDTHDAQARFDAILAAEIAAQNDLSVKQNAFQQLTGQAAEGLAPLTGRVKPSNPEPSDVNAWIGMAEKSSQQIDAKRGLLAIKSAEIDKYRALRQPTVALVAGYSDTRNSSGLTGSPFDSISKSSSIGVKLDIPLYTGGNTSSRLRQALAERDQAQQELEATRRSVALTTKQAFLGVQSGAAQIRALEQALVSAQSSLDSTKLGKEVGVRTILDLLNAQQQFYSTRRDLARARYDYQLNKLRLAQAVGQLSEKDLEAVNGELDR
jgi:outer membrane protein